jgi:hypothetical protein
MRASVGSVAVFVLLLGACTASTSGEASTEGGDTGGATTGGPNTGGGDAGDGGPWGTRSDIEAIFTKDCSQCHADTWSSCWNVHASASAIDSAITYGDMPRGMPMAPADKAAVLAWLQQGAPCFGPEPDAGTTGTGGPPPIGEGAEAP